MMRVISASRTATLVGDFDRSPAYRGLAEALRGAIADGRVPLGARLPSERDLTAALDVSRTTVAAAYAHLRDQGYLVSRRGAGSLAALPTGLGHRGDHLLSPSDASPDRLDLTCAALPAVSGTAAAYEAAVAELPGDLVRLGYHPSGLPALQEVVAQRYTQRGLPTDPTQIVVTTGALAALSVAVRAVTSYGDRVVVESPTYPNAIAGLHRAGLRTAGMPVDAEGWDVETAVATLRQVAPRAAYLIPDFHNPTGLLMPTEQREQLAAALRRGRTIAIVDESLVELGIDHDDGAAPMPLAALAADALSLGSVSKVLWGGLRVGWVRAPERHLDAVVAARLSLDLGAPVLEQRVAALLLRDLDRIVAERRALLRDAREALLSAVAVELPDWRVTRPAGGLSTWARLPRPAASSLAAAAARHDLVVVPGPEFAAEGGHESFLRLPMSLPADDLREAVRRLARAWREVADGSTPAGPLNGPPMVA